MTVMSGEPDLVRVNEDRLHDKYHKMPDDVDISPGTAQSMRNPPTRDAVQGEWQESCFLTRQTSAELLRLRIGDHQSEPEPALNLSSDEVPLFREEVSWLLRTLPRVGKAGQQTASPQNHARRSAPNAQLPMSQRAHEHQQVQHICSGSRRAVSPFSALICRRRHASRVAALLECPVLILAGRTLPKPAVSARQCRPALYARCRLDGARSTSRGPPGSSLGGVASWRHNATRGPSLSKTPCLLVACSLCLCLSSSDGRQS